MSLKYEPASEPLHMVRSTALPLEPLVLALEPLLGLVGNVGSTPA